MKFDLFRRFNLFFCFFLLLISFQALSNSKINSSSKMKGSLRKAIIFNNLILTTQEYNSLSDVDKFIYLSAFHFFINDLQSQNHYFDYSAVDAFEYKNISFQIPYYLKLIFKENAVFSNPLLKVILSPSSTLKLLKYLKTASINGLAGYGAIELLDSLMGRDHSQKDTSNTKSDIEIGDIKPKEKIFLKITKIDVGTPCLFGLYPSKITQIDSKLVCSRPAESRVGCNEEHFLCPDFDLKIDGKPLIKKNCIELNPTNRLGIKCADYLNKELSSVLSSINSSKNGNTGKRVSTLTLDAGNLILFQEAVREKKLQIEATSYFFSASSNANGALTVKSYCESEPVKRDKFQNGECLAFEKFLKSLEGTQALKIIFDQSSSANLDGVRSTQ